MSWRNNHCKAIMCETTQAYLCLVFYMVGYHPSEYVHHQRSLYGSCTLIGSSCILHHHHLEIVPNTLVISPPLLRYDNNSHKDPITKVPP